MLWLALATVLLALANGRWTLALAAWLGPAFMLRFVRDRGAISGLFGGFLALVLVSAVQSISTTPVPAGTDAYVSALGPGLISLLPYAADRLIAPRLRGFLATLVLPLAWTTTEYLYSLASPFGSLVSTAYIQAGNLALLQILSVTGIWGITFLVAWFASVVNWAWEQQYTGEEARVGVGLYAGILLLVLFFGNARLAMFPPASDTVRIASATVDNSEAFQLLAAYFFSSGKPTDDDLKSVRTKIKELHDRLFTLSQREARAGAKIVLWSEFNGVVLKEDEPAFIDRGRALARAEKIYLFMTLATFSPGQKLIENKIVAVDPAGEITATYFKSRPIPGEASVRGDGKIPVLTTPLGKIAAAICFDLDHPGLIRQAGRARADIMLDPSLDWKEIDPIHTYIATFRAIENGFSLVKQTDKGLSAAADYQGRILAAMDYFTTEDRVLVSHVPAQGVATIYSRIGDAFAWLCIAGFAAVLGCAAVRRKPLPVTDRVESVPGPVNFRTRT